MAILPLQLARVSNLLRTTVATQSLAQTQSDLLDVENQLSTGKRLNSPSDDPGAAAIAQQLQKTLETRQAYSANLDQAQSQLGDVDSTLSDLTDLVQQAQTIASANVGSDVTPDARKSAAELVQNLYSQAMSIANHQLNGVYTFAGDQSTNPPFVDANGGVKFVGSDTLLSNQYDESSVLSFQVDGGQIFGATSSQVKGDVDLSPSMSTATRLSDLSGAAGGGVHLGSIQISDGTTSKIVDLSSADTVGDVINLINNAGVGAVNAAIAPNGVSIQISAGASDDVSVKDLAGGTTASDLGILNANGAGTGATLAGGSVHPTVTNLTTLASLRGGAGIDTTGFKITNGTSTANIDLSSANTVEDLLNLVNGSNTGVRAQINSAGTGVDFINVTQGPAMTISETGGTTAADLGVRSFSASTPLAELNDGKGVRTAGGNDFQITDSNGVNFAVDVDGATTIQDVIDKINTAATGASAGVTASFSTTANGIVITDTGGGSGTLTLSAVNFSNAAGDLGIAKAASGTAITGDDVNAVTADGIFTHLAQLRDGLTQNNQQMITAAGSSLQDDYNRVVQVRGDTGARVQDLQSRQDQLSDQNIATQSLLSQIEDTDYPSAIAKFQTLQTSLQASLQTAQQVMNLSLMDYLQ